MSSPVLEAVNLYRFFHAGDEEVLALRGVSLSASAGEMVAIVGPSGSGKSTLLSCLAGLDDPDGGSVRVMGERLSRRSEAARAATRARRIGVLLQTGNLVDHLSIDKNLKVAQQLAGRNDPARRRELLASVGLAERAHTFPTQLSGGERARAALALAVVNNPAILLADEPTGELDATSEQAVLELLLRHASKGAAVVVATHSAAVAAVADRVLHIEDGTLRP